MNDEQFQQLAALHSESGRSRYLNSMVQAIHSIALGLIMVNTGWEMVGALVIVFGVVYEVIAMLKIESKDGSEWANKAASVLPNWEQPMPRDVQTLQDMRDNQLRTDGGEK